MDFNKFESVDNTHERKGGYTLVKEQAYDNLKYRKAAKKTKGKDGVETETIEGRFYVSNARWAGLNLDVNGLRQFTAPDGETLLAVTTDEHATILKLSGKSKEGHKVKNFKSPKLEAALEKLKVIDTTKIGDNQFIDMVSVAKGATIKGVPTVEAFTLAVGSAKPKAAKEEIAATAPVVEAASTISSPVATPVAAVDEWK
jgi:hypothetical protein